MITKIANAWYWVRSSLWFVPGLMIFSAFGLAAVALNLDQAAANGTRDVLHGVYAGGPEGARSLLSTVAGTMITVAGVVFSVTIVALSLASSQFGPRILQSFMRDLGNQIVLGVFLSTFVYCLLILRTIRNSIDQHPAFVPQFSITIGLLLSLVSIGFLVFFIHHVAGSIQVDDIIAKIAGGTAKGGSLSWIDKAGVPWEPGGAPKPEPPGESDVIRARMSGYIQSGDAKTALALAVEQDVVMEFLFRPGDFLTQGDAFVRFWPKKNLSESFQRQVQNLFLLGAHRTPIQDFGYGINLLVEIAIRALSPSINDPSTAMMCLDRLQEILAPLAERPAESGCRADPEGNPRLIDHPLTFPEMLRKALDPIRHFGAENPLIAQRVLAFLKLAMERTRDPECIQALSVQARLFSKEEMWAEPEDRERVRECYAAFLQARTAVLG